MKPSYPRQKGSFAINPWSLTVSLCLMITLTVQSAEKTGRQVMEEQKARHEASSEYEKVTMVLVDSSDKKETRELKRYLKKDNEGLFKYLIRFEAPADVRGVSLLTWQQKGGEDNQWLYLPAYGEKLKRIAGGGKKSYFMGTDFAYEDLRSEKLDDHNYQIVKQEKVDNQNCYVIEASPATEEEQRSSGYGKRILWINTENFFTLKAEFYDHSMKLLKASTAYGIKPISGKLMRAEKVLMDHHQNKHKTAMQTLERTVGESIEDSIFTERSVLSFK